MRQRLGGLLLIVGGLWLMQMHGGGIPLIPSEPAPFDIPGNRCLIIYESSQLSALPPEQLSVLQGGAVRDYLAANCVPGPNDSGPEYRIWDKDQNLEYVPDAWKRVFEKTQQVDGFELPWIVVSNGRTGWQGPLPATEDDALELLRKWLE